MGAARGAAEIKRHPFFAGVDWALIRCVTPPVVPEADAASPTSAAGAKFGSWNSLGGNSFKKTSSSRLYQASKLTRASIFLAVHTLNNCSGE